MRFKKITISGKICTGKTTLLENLAKKLSWPTYLTGKVFRKYVLMENLTLEKAEEQNEALTKKIDGEVALMLKEDNNLIVDGWMSRLSANGQKDVLRVLLICDDKIRYRRYAKRENLSEKEAMIKVEERQKNWFDKILEIHHIKADEFLNEKNYDLVIDTSYITPQAITKIVIKKLN